jgi:hypothetical protein
MSSLTLERARASHEDIEAYERAIVAILEDKPRTVRTHVVCVVCVVCVVVVAGMPGLHFVAVLGGARPPLSPPSARLPRHHTCASRKKDQSPSIHQSIDQPTTQQNKERVWQQHRIANLIEQIQRRAEDLEGIYDDKDGCVRLWACRYLIHPNPTQPNDRYPLPSALIHRTPQHTPPHTPRFMKEEVATLRGREAFPNFYERLEQAKEYHQRFPNLPVKHHVSVFDGAGMIDMVSID